MVVTIESRWPDPEAFLDLATIEQVTDGRARCTYVAICDGEGNPLQSFYQGQMAHFFFEFEILDKIGVPAGGLEFHNESGLVIHGKNSFQYDAELPQSAEAGQRLRYHQVIQLDVAPGEYSFTVGLSSAEEVSYRSYSRGAAGDEQFAPQEHCRAVNVTSFVVRFNEREKLRHHGIANLYGESRFAVMPSTRGASAQFLMSDSVEVNSPVIIHVTHWKAGSQWIHRILNECVPDRVVAPQLNQAQFLNWPMRLGRVYPTVYVTKTRFDRRPVPPNTRHFVIIRDLRDTLVSAYFSMKISHPLMDRQLGHMREVLQSSSHEDGLLYMIDKWLSPCAEIQISWLEADEPMIRYEDLLEQDMAILERTLVDHCQLPVTRERLRQVVIASRFEHVTQGRARGNENVHAHERKGMAGDWRNHFTERVKRAFKNRYGGLLVATGYEPDLNW